MRVEELKNREDDRLRVGWNEMGMGSIYEKTWVFN